MDPQENDTELIDVPLDESSFGGEEGTKPEIAATSKVERLIQWAVVFAIFVFLFWLLGTPLLGSFSTHPKRTRLDGCVRTLHASSHRYWGIISFLYR